MKPDHAFLKLYANCVIVQGSLKSLIIDLQRGETYRIDSTFISYFDRLNQAPYDEILSYATSEEKELIEQIKDFIVSNELGFFCKHPENFPELDYSWESNRKIENAIVDIDKDFQFLSISLKKLDAIECQHIQIRIFSPCRLSILQRYLSELNSCDFHSCELIIQYNVDITIDTVKDFMSKFPAIYCIYIVNSPAKECFTIGEESTRLMHIYYLTQQVLNCESCGQINLDVFSVPNVEMFCERQSCNSCLNRKISIDTKGQIKNCPAFNTDYGNIINRSLTDIVDLPNFTRYWHIAKKDISTCRECEYRAICVDCRVFLSDNNDIYSKPLKCKYNPFLGEWNN